MSKKQVMKTWWFMGSLILIGIFLLLLTAMFGSAFFMFLCDFYFACMVFSVDKQPSFSEFIVGWSRDTSVVKVLDFLKKREEN